MDYGYKKFDSRLNIIDHEFHCLNPCESMTGSLQKDITTRNLVDNEIDDESRKLIQD